MNRKWEELEPVLRLVQDERRAIVERLLVLERYLKDRIADLQSAEEEELELQANKEKEAVTCQS